MSLSKTNIANQALSRVGAKTILDIDDTNSTSARVIKNVFEASVREVSRMHDWNCLKARASLAQNATGPDFGWSYQYNLPVDCEKLCTVNGYEDGTTEDLYEIEGRTILTDSDECKITYIQYKEATGDYDSLFIEALVVWLASKIATSIRQDESVSKMMRDEFHMRILPAARMKDGNERKRKRVYPSVESEWVNRRWKATKR